MPYLASAMLLSLYSQLHFMFCFFILNSIIALLLVYLFAALSPCSCCVFTYSHVCLCGSYLDHSVCNFHACAYSLTVLSSSSYVIIVLQSLYSGSILTSCSEFDSITRHDVSLKLLLAKNFRNLDQNQKNSSMGSRTALLDM